MRGVLRLCSVLIGLGFVWALVSPALAATPEQSVIRAVQEGDWDKAARALQRLRPQLASKSRGKAARRTQMSFLAARVALQRGQAQEALQWLGRVRVPALMQDWFLYHKGLALLGSGQAGQAVAAFRRLSGQGAFWHRRATTQLLEALERAGQWSQLARLARQLRWRRSWEPEYDRLWWLELKALRKMGRVQQARRDMQDWLRMYPNSLWAAQGRKILQQWAKQGALPAPANKRWKVGEILKLASKHPLQAQFAMRSWWRGLSASQQKQTSTLSYKLMIEGESLYSLGKWADALVPLRTLLQDRRYSGSLRYLAAKRLGRIYPVLSRHKEGEKVFLRYAQERPGYRATGLSYYLLAWMALYQQKYRLAHERFGIYWQKYPKASTIRRYWRARWFQAWCLYRQGRYREAVAGFQLMRKLAWRYMTYRRQLYWIARSYERWDKPKKAMALYVQVVRRHPLSYYGLMSLQRLYQAKQTQGRAASCRLRGMTRGRGAAVWKAMCAGKLTEMPPAWQADRTREARVQTIIRRNRRLALSPPMPRQCLRSQRGLCRFLHRARWLAEIGLSRDAAAEMSRGIKLFWRAPRQMLAAIRWLHAAGGHYTAITSVRRLEKAPYRVRFPEKERLYMHYPPVYARHMLDSTQKAGLATEMAWSILREESLYRPRVYSNVGAYGLMQVIAPTGRKIAQHLQIKDFHAPKHLWDIATNIRMGSWYLSQLVQRLGGNMFLASAGYNAGPHYAIAWLKGRRHLDMDEFAEEIWITETRHYVKRIFRSYAVYSYLYRGRVPPLLPDVKIQVANNIDF